MRQMNSMEHPQTHPHLNFEMRAFPCPDGITRTVNLPDYYWSWIEKFLQRYNHSMEKIVATCTTIANDNHREDAFQIIMHHTAVIYYRKLTEKSPLACCFHRAAQNAPSCIPENIAP